MCFLNCTWTCPSVLPSYQCIYLPLHVLSISINHSRWTGFTFVPSNWIEQLFFHLEIKHIRSLTSPHLINSPLLFLLHVICRLGRERERLPEEHRRLLEEQMARNTAMEGTYARSGSPSGSTLLWAMGGIVCTVPSQLWIHCSSYWSTPNIAPISHTSISIFAFLLCFLP